MNPLNPIPVHRTLLRAPQQDNARARRRLQWPRALRTGRNTLRIGAVVVWVVLALLHPGGSTLRADITTQPQTQSPAETPAQQAAASASQARRAANLTAGVMDLTPALPALLGTEEPKTYLLLIQNNHELRATGGFISAVATVTLEDGRIRDLQFADSYEIARSDVNHPAAPEPQQRYMGIPLVFLRDANWSPDFQTTAQLVRSLYAQDAGVRVDGIATIDLRAVELLIGALGPLVLEGSDTPVTGANVVEQVVQFWDRPLETGTTFDKEWEAWWEQRKDFMPLLAQAALDRLNSGSVNLLALAGAAKRAFDERAVQIWMAEPAAAGMLAELGWDGALQPEPGADYVALVETNMGYNKVNAVVTRTLHYAAAWPEGPDAPAEATVTITYRHPLEAPVEACNNKEGYGKTYTDLIERCYFNYVRLYVPGGSELVRVDGVEPDSVESRLGERGTQVFAGYFSMFPGSTHTVTFTYRLPPHITPEGYRLALQRQSGTQPLPLEIEAGPHRLSTAWAGNRLLWLP